MWLDVSLGLPSERPSLSSALCGKLQHKPQGTSWLSVQFSSSDRLLITLGALFLPSCPLHAHTYIHVHKCQWFPGTWIWFPPAAGLHSLPAEVVLFYSPCPPWNNWFGRTHCTNSFLLIDIPTVTSLTMDHSPSGLLSVFGFTLL